MEIQGIPQHEVRTWRDKAFHNTKYVHEAIGHSSTRSTWRDKAFLNTKYIHREETRHSTTQSTWRDRAFLNTKYMKRQGIPQHEVRT
ncbi:hypothetical protein Bpfe_020464 [Biomphalaria pfeifferi]|uniref:Uncharacterized protein n=1 Tax=Biomphalaria pfeifferi TaxID=112525 RepID=A0AAD8B8Q9_BIOPF|nr:hypothetical protein Bpfe_020464 [Biomphalaria pfeifferi]